jgi:hypothetical protein
MVEAIPQAEQAAKWIRAFQQESAAGRREFAAE